MNESGLPEPDPSETDALIRRIEAGAVARRARKFDPPVRVGLSAADPLRAGIIGGTGAYAVRRLLQTLRFDEHRAMGWRLEHKLVFASVVERYAPGALPRTWGLGALVRALGPTGLRGAIARTLPGGVFIKTALGCLSGDREEADSSVKILNDLERGVDLTPPGPRMSDEVWIVQERIPVEREYRVHSMEGTVLDGYTFLRYAPGLVPDGQPAVDAFVRSVLDRLPDGMVGESFWSWDVAVDAAGRPRVIEVNLAGFHPVRYRGFQCSGFFQARAVGPQLLADLFDYAADTYGVAVEIPEHGAGDLFNDPGVLEVVRRLADREPAARQARARAPVYHRPDRVDAVLHLNERGVGRFAILKRSLDAFRAPLGTCWVVTPDDQLGPIADRFASPRFAFVAESDVLPELNGQEPASPLCRTQAAKLAAVARRVESEFLIDLTPDTICTRPFTADDLIPWGRPTRMRALWKGHVELYRTAERLLGVPRSGFVYGDVVGVLRRGVVLDLIARLEAGGPGRGWPGVLLGEPAWSIVSLYFTRLDSLGLDRVLHAPTSVQFAGKSVWDAQDWPDWDPKAAFAPDSRHCFTVLRTGPVVSAREVWERVGPFVDGPGGVENHPAPIDVSEPRPRESLFFD